MNSKVSKLKEQIATVIVGKGEVTELILTAFFAGGHVLVEDMPGTGKTSLSKALAKGLDASFSRIQFTPDLLPTDITGLNVFQPKTGEFILKKGPVFSQIVLADEINRATPRTQAALLECMEEHQVTIDGETMGLAEPFFVIATQNPIENAGTFTLPEAQLDRFYMKVSMGALSEEDELAMIDRFETGTPLDEITAAMSDEDVLNIRGEIKKVFLHPVLKKYITDICRGTRNIPKVICGVSPRAILILSACAKAYAYLQGRTYVIPEDIKLLAVPVLAHRLVLSAELKRTGNPEAVIKQVLSMTAVPTEDWRN